ncbi:hypothetical protein EV643_114166 [Kribbella sp. VKM Ac-2527]|uniref:Uncharacterized protein n=1 Tax=Kribbella caucasensis TaxID=2512215 RepID=A0A4R6KBL8_9ACTN|nr:hypothetical protein [Kribbella sp. VKM Ac-2527]TDO45021.1 hypothetical protein EV643_114166 [Kribbella sp. VKM Ac-2527]
MVTAGNLTGVDSAPPVTKTPNQPQTIITGPPTTNPTTTVTVTPKESIIASANTLPPIETSTDTPPPPPPPSDTPPPAVEPVNVSLQLKPTINRLTVTMQFAESGSMLVPIIERTGESKPADSWRNNVYMTGYTWGDGSPGAGANAGLLTCKGAHERVSGSGTGTAREPHTYATGGTYTFTYTFYYCGPDGIEKSTKTMKLTVSRADVP